MRLLICLFVLIPHFISAQDLTGKWTGKLPQDDKPYDFQLELRIEQNGEVLEGECKIIQPSTNNFVVQKFNGRVQNDRVRITEYEAIESTEAGDWFWCIKDFDGQLQINESSNEMVISGQWKGTGKLFAAGQYYGGNCTPGSFFLSKPIALEVTVSGKVYDIKTGEGIASSEINIIRQGKVKTDQNGNYKVTLSPNEIYNLVVSKEGYRDFIAVLNTTVSDIKQDYYLEQKQLEIKENERIKLSKVLFQRGKDVLMSGSYEQLDQLCDYLINNSDKSILLEGHTDRLGNSKSNKELSEMRTKAIKSYLIKKGISKKRISTVGYGDSKTICKPPCADNRRVEFVIQ